MVTVGGIAALSWEVVWQLQASIAFGASSAGTALTLAATMGGMSVGSLVAGAWLRRRPGIEPLRAYGVLELLIGLSGLLALPGFRALELLDAAVFAHLPGLASPLHGVGIALLVGPATFAMGATVPVFQLVARGYGTRVSVLYGMNTAGAAAGVLLMSFVLMPRLGVIVTCVLVASINGAVFLLSRVIPRAQRFETPTAVSSAQAAALPAGLALFLVACTGFATFALEVVWFRALRAAFWSTTSTFAVMLAAVLIPLAAGARCVPWFRRRGVRLVTLLAGAGVATLLATPLVERMDLVVAQTASHPAALAIWFGLCLAVLGPAVFCLATALPWCLETHTEPGMSGLLYGANTLGSVAGALIAASYLLPTLGFARAAWALAVLIVVASLTICTPGRRWIVVCIGAACLLVAVLSSSSPGRERMLNLRDLGGHRVLVHEEGADFTTSVVETPEGARHLYIDGFAASTAGALGTHYMVWMGALPALLHPDPQRGLIIGFGTGQTANAMRHEEVPEIDVVEISRAVLDLAPFFDANEDVLGDPRVRAVVMDGRAWLRRVDRRYDLITLEPMPPNFAGVNSLYSLEFYEIMARRLAPGGIVAQWLPIHLLNEEHAASAVATFVAVFPDSVLWIDPRGATGILLGRRGGAEPPLGARWPGFDRVVRQRSLEADETRRGIFLYQDELARYGSRGRVITDSNQLLQYSRLRAGIGGRGRRLTYANAGIMSEIAGRRPFTLPSD